MTGLPAETVYGDRGEAVGICVWTGAEWDCYVYPPSVGFRLDAESYLGSAVQLSEAMRMVEHADEVGVG